MTILFGNKMKFNFFASKPDGNPHRTTTAPLYTQYFDTSGTESVVDWSVVYTGTATNKFTYDGAGQGVIECNSESGVTPTFIVRYDAGMAWDNKKITFDYVSITAHGPTDYFEIFASYPSTGSGPAVKKINPAGNGVITMDGGTWTYTSQAATAFSPGDQMKIEAWTNAGLWRIKFYQNDVLKMYALEVGAGAYTVTGSIGYKVSFARSTGAHSVWIDNLLVETFTP